MTSQTEDLTKKADSDLASWQAGWTPGSEWHILAEKERERRRDARDFPFHTAIAESNRRWSIALAVIAALSTFLGAVVGAYLAN